MRMMAAGLSLKKCVVAAVTVTVMSSFVIPAVNCAETATASESAGATASTGTTADPGAASAGATAADAGTTAVSDLKQQLKAADDLVAKDDFAGAEPLYEKALQTFSDTDNSFDKAVVSLRLAEAQYQLKKYDQTLALLKFCLPVFASGKKADPDEYGEVTEMLSRTYRHLGQLDEATTYGKLNRKFVTKRFGTKSVEYAYTQRNLGKLHLEQARYADAEVVLKECLAIFESPEVNMEPSSVAVVLSLLIDSLKLQKKDADCVEYQKRLDAIRNN